MIYKREPYPDGGHYVNVTDFSNPIIIEKINSFEDLFFIKSLKDVCDYNQIKDVELVIPCMFQQQHDRRFKEYQSHELQIVADFINSCNFSKVHVFHPHSEITGALINNFREIDNSFFIKQVLADLPTKPIILSTDAGSYKWINKLADVLEFDGEVYGASKARSSYLENGVMAHRLTQVLDRQDFQGKDILVIDDLCVKGGTFIGLAEMLKERNAGKLFLAVSHITVQNPNFDLAKFYDTIYATNSKYDKYNLPNLQLISLFEHLNEKFNNK